MYFNRVIINGCLRTSCRNLFKSNDFPGSVLWTYPFRATYRNIQPYRTSQKLEDSNSAVVLARQKRQTASFAATLVQAAPGSVQPYLKLLRLDKPIGSWLLFWPCGWSIAMAASPGALPDFYLISLVGTGAVIMRGAGCIINDLWDRDIDIKVERTKDRPLASGAITPTKAIVFLSGTLLSGLLVLLQFNWYCIFLGASSLCLVATYPLAKRIFSWPQLGLGVVFNWGALFGWAAVHGACDFSVCVPLYLGCISWTLVYDTIYAFQDKRDDATIGIKSTALTWNSKSKSYMLAFTASMAASLFTAGVMCDQTLPYYALVGAGSSWLAYRCAILDTENAFDCNKLFVLNSLLGAVVMLGIVLGTLRKKSKDQQKSITDQ